MIFYFSGTGNSLYTAKKLSDSLQEPICNIAECIQNERFDYFLKREERLAFVFPVYAWGMPTPVMTFLENMEISSITPYYTFAVVTCSKSIGKTMDILKKMLRQKNIYLNSGFSLPMPDNYVVLYDIESKQQQQQKLSQADKYIYKIAKAVILERNHFFRVETGSFPILKSSIVNALFHHFYANTKHFYTTGECTGCGECESLCPAHAIHMQSEKPVWEKGQCYMCLSCLHGCPKGAIQYTKQTEKHGRYNNPNL